MRQGDMYKSLGKTNKQTNKIYICIHILIGIVYNSVYNIYKRKVISFFFGFFKNILTLLPVCLKYKIILIFSTAYCVILKTRVYNMLKLNWQYYECMRDKI